MGGVKTWTVDELRQYIGGILDTRRPRTSLEEQAYGGPGETGGRGVLVGVEQRPCAVEYGGVVKDYGVVPWIQVDYGFSWPILPGTEITFTPVESLERELARLEAKLAAIGEPIGYMVVEDRYTADGVPLPGSPPVPDWDGLIHDGLEAAQAQCDKANGVGEFDEPGDGWRVVVVYELPGVDRGA